MEGFDMVRPPGGGAVKAAGPALLLRARGCGYFGGGGSDPRAGFAACFFGPDGLILPGFHRSDFLPKWDELMVDL